MGVKQGPERNIVIAMSVLCLLVWALWLVTVIENQIRAALAEAVASARPPVAEPWIYQHPFEVSLGRPHYLSAGPITYNSIQTMEPR